MYFVYRPVFTPSYGTWFTVRMQPVAALAATNAEDAMREAKHRGFPAPIVGIEHTGELQ